MAKVELLRRTATAEDGIAVRLDEAQGLARQAFRDLRELAQGIHPAVLTDQGVVAAVRSRTTQLPIPVALNVSPAVEKRRFAADSEAAAYFLICEALTNAAKHADCTTARVCIDALDGVLHVTVEDDGAGLDPSAPQRGLRGLRDRLEALGGRLEIAPAEPTGTRVSGWLPG
jgi:signal transduction histidine kinase